MSKKYQSTPFKLNGMHVAIMGSVLSCGAMNLAQAAAPVVKPTADVQISQGQQLVVPVQLNNSGQANNVNWSKAYGPDDVKVNPVTGAVSWQVPARLPSESFHIGVRASNLEGSHIDSFIVHVGVTKVVYIGPNEPEVTNFSKAFSHWKSPGSGLREAGTTFVVRNGSYSGSDWELGLTSSGAVQQPPAGTATKYTTVMAEDPGQVRLSNGADLVGRGNFGGVAYWAIKGFHVEAGSIGLDGSGCNAGDNNCRPHHIKFIQNGVHLAHTGSSFGANHASYVLFENNYAYGGNRTKFQAYKVDKSVFRRNVARFDHNQDHTGPKNTFSFYTSMDIAAQNNIAVDSDQLEFVDYGEIAGEFGCPTTAGDSRATWDRNIQLNSDMLHANLDRQNGKCYATINDVVAWDNRSPVAFVFTRSPSLFNHATFGAIDLDSPTVVFNGWPGTFARGITNSIIHDVKQGPMFEGLAKGSTTDADGQPLARYGIDTVNITGFDGRMITQGTDINQDTLTDYDPLWSSSNPEGGLRYLVRIEPNSNLSGKAQDGGDLGATVLTFKGKSGTLWGEAGYDDETNAKAWPFPYQETIAEKMRSMSYTGPTWTGPWRSRVSSGTKTLSGNRGFANPETNLTDYIWGYLGSTVPPMNVSATAGPKSAIIRWDGAAPRASITSYKVYDFNPETQAISNPRDVGTKSSFAVNGLENGESYYFAVTAVDSENGESSWSYPVEVTPQTRPKPLPPILTGGDS